MPEPWRLTTVLLWEFNPTTVHLATSVLSEPCFLFLCLCLFLCLRNFLNTRRGNGLPFLMGLLCGWAALVRPQGCVLLPAVALGLAYEKEWRAFRSFTAVSATLWGGVLLRNHLVSHEVAGYMSSWRDILPALGVNYGLFFRHMADVLRAMIFDGLLAFPWPAGSPAVVAASFLFFLSYAAGVNHSEKNKTMAGGLSAAVNIFVLFYLLIHLLWSAVDPRYFLPLLPFLTSFAILGLRASFPRRRISNAAIGVILSFVFLSYGLQNAHALNETRHRPIEDRVPMATYRWMEGHLSDASFTLAFSAYPLCLYAHEHTVPFLPSDDKEQFRYLLLRRGITHVLIAPLPIVPSPMIGAKDGTRVWRDIERWASLPGDALKETYRNEPERTILYEVARDDDYPKAYELHDFEEQSWAEGFRKLDLSLSLHPDFAHALNAYGAAAISSGLHKDAAERFLQKAIRTDPDFSRPYFNLARLYQSEGREDLAKALWKQAQAMVLAKAGKPDD